jgi:hypothetical protein
MATGNELQEPSFGPVVSNDELGRGAVDEGRQSGEARGESPDADSDDMSSPEEENESRIPGDPREINELQPPTATQF